MYLLLLTLSSSVWVAWQYAKIPSDPDFGLFALRGLTGTKLGEVVDCKSPGVHLWYWLLAVVSGRDERRVRFLHSLIVSWTGALLAYGLTGNGWAALAMATLLQSGWLMAFHGNVDQIPAVLWLVVIAAPSPWLAAGVALLAVAFEPKLIFSMLGASVLGGWWLELLPLMALGGLACLALWKFWPDTWAWVWEWGWVIPGRMHARRVKEHLYKFFMPWFTSQSALFLLPWLAGAILARPDWRYWLPLALYLGLVAYGRVVRNLHLFPVAAYVALSGISPEWVITLAATDWISAGLYLPDIWLRHYGALRESCNSAEAVGRWLKDKPGTLWVNGIETQIHIYAGKPAPFGMTEQVEMREVATERRELFRERFKECPPDWVVIGTHPGLKFRPTGYSLIGSIESFQVYHKN